jgi:hypothetical protein
MSQAPPFDWKNAEIVDFKVMNEDWQIYKLSDESVLKVKLILTQVWRSRNQVNPITAEPLYMWNTMNTLALLSFPENLRGQPSAIPITPELVAQSFDRPVDFELSGKQDEWNVYNLTDTSVLRLRLDITTITRTKLKGAAGEPIHSVAGGLPNYRLKVADELIKKPKGQAMPDAKSQAYG